MNNEGALSANTDGFGRVTTFCYDATANCVHVDEKASGPVLAADGRTIKPASPPAAAVPRKPILTHTFEFRLSGSETQEQVVPLSGSKSWAAGGVLAIQRVRTYLTRQGVAAAATSAIGGVEVHAELCEGCIFCTVELGDFGAGDLIVVQVDVALY
jgi:hypothetical protein